MVPFAQANDQYLFTVASKLLYPPVKKAEV
jgi:hypothetical protein